ncbi:cupin domain-containing protein [Auraticoccus monumenti]|uniref:Cupin domain-containing protein n=1 Tax=Auraticoccus monumenti TaxID=675864 RepID=A0A1G6XRP7_9ACTN|nr:cupin domain-containing protein [Auraticoccus monumenti]SDD80115.1 Cupin domain-containing protein [Auraticoccus monumenti]
MTTGDRDQTSPGSPSAGSPSAGSPDVVPALAAARLSGEDLELVEWVAEPGPDGGAVWQAPLHVHHADDEAWYVLSGRMVFRLGPDVVEVGPGGAALARAGVAHTFGVVGDEPARYLLVMTPRVAQLVATLHDPALAAGRSAAQVFTDHASTLLG